MKIMIFIDDSNFFNSMQCIKKEKNQDRIIDYYKVSKFVLNFLQNNMQYKYNILSHIRTYLYDGEYTDALLNRIKKEVESTSGEEKSRFADTLRKAEHMNKGQKKKLKRIDNHYFFEVRLKPLQFSKREGIFQKGVDVQLAVDLVSNAYLNNYDIAVLFSGDIDLLESVKLVKSLGKHVIIFSHWEQMAIGMLRATDLFVDFKKLTDKQLDQFTHIFQKKKEKP